MIKKFLNKVLILIALIFLFTIDTNAVEPEEVLKNSEQELIARNISKSIRCLVCQNQSIDESSSPLAKDLRILIRKKINDGYSENEIYDFLTDRYGDFILLKPPFKLSTFALWLLPFFFLLIGIVIVLFHNKKSKII